MPSVGDVRASGLDPDAEFAVPAVQFENAAARRFVAPRGLEEEPPIADSLACSLEYLLRAGFL
jgi:hypothetical protein